MGFMGSWGDSVQTEAWLALALLYRGSSLGIFFSLDHQASQSFGSLEGSIVFKTWTVPVVAQVRGRER